MKELQYLNKYFIKYKYHFFFGILTTIVANIFGSLLPNLFSHSITAVKDYFDSGLASSREAVQGRLLHLILLMVGSTLINAFLTFWTRQWLIVMSRHIEFDLKNEVFRQYENLTQHFYKQNRTGDLMNRISEDVSKVRMYVGPAVMYTITTVIRFVVVMVFMYQTSPRLMLYTMIPLPLLSYAIFKLSTQINKKSTLFQQNLSALSSFSQEVFSGLRVIKAYALEAQYRGKVADLSGESRAKAMDLAWLNSLFGPLMLALIGVSNLVVIYFGGLMYINGTDGVTDIGIIAAFILYVNMLTFPVASLGWVSSMVQEAAASQKRINEFLKIKPEITNTQPNRSEIMGDIVFDKVSFVYEDTQIKALDSVSFHLKKGQTLAILGKTGSGKSTLLQLIGRLYDSTSGNLRIDGHNIAELNLYDLRDSIGTVPQDAFLFSDTIKNNIRFGKENATEEEVIQAAQWAAVHDNIVNFNLQYETLLGERGITLSGGQKQRVSIARALIKDPQILLLDDCLSAVDTETEETILANLSEASRGKTTVIVSHRVSSARNADQIIVLDQGHIVEQGTHNQLLNKDGYYRELYLAQLAEKN